MVSGSLREVVPHEQAFAVRKENFSNEIRFYAPGLKNFRTKEFHQKKRQAFRPISLTGNACGLQCEHCKSKILEPMIALNSQEGLFELCQRLAANGTEGVLISGGSQRTGAVPLLKYTDEIARIKNELGLKVMVHCGVVDESTSLALKQAKVDGVMLDIIGAKETIRDVYHLDLSIDDFERSLAYLIKDGHSVRPHIILGLHFGKFMGEHTALGLIEKYPIHSLILVILTPMLGTPMQDLNPPKVSEIANFFHHARLRMPDTPLMLGCARPLGKHKESVDKAAIDYGLNGIAYPAEGIIRYAQSKGLCPSFYENSCACGG